jgi:sulfur carrier protein ThiS
MVKVSGLRIGELEVTIEGTEGLTLLQVLAEAGIRQEGAQFVINGRPTTDLNAAIVDGDEIEVADRPKAGR